MRYKSFVFVGLALFAAACATTPAPDLGASLKQAEPLAWSLKIRPAEMIVDVSPAGGVLKWAGSTGVVLGAGVDAVVNDKYRQVLKEALGDYDTNAVFQERLRKRLGEVLGDNLKEVAPLGSTAGLDTRQEAQDLRFERLWKQGCDLVLDLAMTHGVFGSGATLVVQVEGTANALPKGSRVYNNTIIVTTGPVLADTDLGNPTKGALIDTSFNMTVDDDAVARWAKGDAGTFKEHYEAAVDAVISAALCDLGVAEDALGEYHLGLLAMNRKKFEEAEKHFANAVALEPGYADALNARAVNLGHDDRFEEAIAAAKSLTETSPEYGPAWYNLAWWLAVEKGDAAAAKPCYERAQELGMPRAEKIEKAIGKGANSRS